MTCWTRIAVAALFLVAGCSSPSRSEQFRDGLEERFAAEEGGGLGEDARACAAAEIAALADDDLEQRDASVEQALDGPAADLDLDDAASLADLFDDCDLRFESVHFDELVGLAGELVELAGRHAYTNAIELIDPVSALELTGLVEPACMADAIVDAIGLDRLADAAAPDELATASSLLATGIRFDSPTAAAFAHSIGGCTDQDGLVLRTALRPALFEAPDPLYECVEGQLDRAGREAVLYAGALTNGQGFVVPAAQDAVTAALEECGPGVEVGAALTRSLLRVLVTDPARPLAAHEGACIVEEFVGTLTPARAASLATTDIDDAGALGLLQLLPEEAAAFSEAVGLCSIPFDVLVVVLPLESLTTADESCLAAAFDGPHDVLAVLTELAAGAPVASVPRVADALAGCGLG